MFTFELKNSLTKQTADDAVLQYQQDRNPREKLFEFGRCIAHFAVDEREVQFCTRLAGKASYAQVVEAKDEKSGRKRRTQIWPRYHQLDVVRRLLADAGEHGAGRRYLIQHSAGSGKSNSIAWLAHQLIGLTRDDAPVFDSIIVVTDRVILDRQIRDTIRQYAQVGATVGHADRSGDLRRFIESGKKTFISTVQKVRFILDEIGDEQRGRRFSTIIDETHSSRGERTSAAMAQALSGSGEVGEPRLSLIVPVVLSGEWSRGAAPGPAYWLPVLRTIRLPCESGRCVLPLRLGL